MLKSITLLGSSSGKNAGDAALLSGVMDSIDNALGRRLVYEIPTSREWYVWNEYHNKTRPVSMMPWMLTAGMFGAPTLASVCRTDMTMIFDNPLFDRDLWNPIFNYMPAFRTFLPIAKRMGKTLGCFNVGMGPVTTPAGQKMLKEICNLMDFIAVREERSVEIMREIGVQNENILVTADAALTVTPAPKQRVDQIMKERGIDPEAPFLAININKYLDTWAKKSGESMGKDKFIEIYAKALEQAAEEINLPIVFVCTQHHDIEVTEELMNRTKTPLSKKLVDNRTLNHYEVQGFLSRASLLFGMRLHSQILATSQYTPTVGLIFQDKVRFYWEKLGLPECALSFDNFTVEGIRDHILFGWRNRDSIRSRLEQAVPIMREQAHVPGLLISRLESGMAVFDAVQVAKEELKDLENKLQVVIKKQAA